MPYGSGVLQPGVTTRSEVHQLLGKPFFVNKEWQIEISKDVKENYYTIATYDKEGYLKSIEPGWPTDIPYRYRYPSRHNRLCFNCYRFHPFSGDLFSPSVITRLVQMPAKQGECVLLFMPRCAPSRAYIDDVALGVVGRVDFQSPNILIKRLLTPGDHTFRTQRIGKGQDCSFELDFNCKSGETVYLYGRGPNFFGIPGKRAFVSKRPQRVIENVARFLIPNDKKISESEWKVKKEVGSYCPNADLGHADAQKRIGDLLYHGKYGLNRNLVRAHVWYTLAVNNGNGDAAEMRKQVASYLSPEEIQEANRLLEEWKPGQCKGDLMNALPK